MPFPYLCGMNANSQVIVMPIRKSADDIRKQSDRIYAAACQRLHNGTLNGREFTSLITRVFDTEARYVGNIRSQERYKYECSKSEKKADATQYMRDIYMSGNPTMRAAL